MRTLPRTFVEKVRALDYDSIREAVEGYLTDAEVEAVLARRDLVLARVEELIAEHGEESVLY